MPQSKSIQDESHTIAWLGNFVLHGGPRYLQIADFIGRALSEGLLKAGERLPPQRRLATLLQVDLTTVTRAYDEAKRRNLVEGRGAQGTYAAAPKVELSEMLDLSLNMPPPPEGIDFDDMLKQGLTQVLLRTDVRNEARARQVLTRQVLAGTLTGPGDGIHVWLPLPSYWTSRELAATARAEGLAVTASDAFVAGPQPPNAIRISLGASRERTRLAAALRKLSQLLARKPPIYRDIVI